MIRCEIVLLLLLVCIIILIVLFLLQIKTALRIKNEKEKLEKEIKRINVNSAIMKDWLMLKQKGISLSDWLIKCGITKVSLYGYGILGKAFYHELKDSDVEILCIIDRNYKNINSNIPAVSPDNVPDSQAIVVSVINYYDEIEKELACKYRCPIISLEDIVYGVGYNFDE